MTYKKADAIAAISTPQGVGGCALVRMTGKDAITVADRFFKNFRKVLPSDMQGYTSAYGDIIDIDGNKVDSVVLTVFREPYRKVVITSDNPRKNYNRKGKGNGKYNNRNRKGGKYRRDDNYVPKPKSMDSMKTSFEKEYSKPKPEDNIEGGLYGKIEL